jgi:hypothetical protein
MVAGRDRILAEVPGSAMKSTAERKKSGTIRINQIVMIFNERRNQKRFKRSSAYFARYAKID